MHAILYGITNPPTPTTPKFGLLNLLQGHAKTSAPAFGNSNIPISREPYFTPGSGPFAVPNPVISFQRPPNQTQLNVLA